LKRNLILVTNHFPFGLAESFLEEEIDYLVSRFDQVVVLARDVTSAGMRKETSGFKHHRINPESDIKEKILASFLVLANLGKCYSFVKEEITDLQSRRTKISFAVFSTMMHDLIKAITTAHHIERTIKSHNMTGTVFLYSYWLNSSALALTFVKEKSGRVIRFSRAHGGDVYESRSKNSYLSFRKTLITTLDRIFAISESAKRHLADRIGGKGDNIVVSRLGTHGKQSGEMIPERPATPRIVSCSFLVPVKRVHLIIEALSQVTAPLEWVHIGDGPLRNELERLASEKLSDKPNIRYRFMGSLTHDKLLEYYQKHYVDLFLNTSSSEGIPVTMMEAQSFGIPVLAPDVGGIAEIISETNGRLFPANASPTQIAGEINSLLSLPPGGVESLRAEAFRNWQVRYNAEKNFPTFVADILNI
jgi:glycosyltransferase involved in cell wall biosynthesis